MQDYQKRVIEEAKELDEKRRALVDFMHGDAYASLPAIEQGLLMIQLVAMENYASALSRRIELF